MAAQRPDIVGALALLCPDPELYDARRRHWAGGRFFAGWAVDVGSGTFPAQTLIAAGQQDSIVGYTDAMN